MKPSRPLVILAFGVLLAVSPSRRLAAQVGVDPAHSPYHDILHGTGWTFTAEQVYGNGGPLHLSPNSGTGFGIRYDIRFSRLMQGFVSLSRLSLQREVLAPDDSLIHRYSGPFTDAVWTPAIGMQFNLSGSKSWHGIAPFVAVGMGAAVGAKISQDTSQFVFGTKLMFSPSAGLRYFIGERLHLRLEGELLYWKMKYPSTWTNEPSKQPSTTGQPSTAPVKNVAGLSDWIPTPGLKFGIGYSF